MNKLMSDKAVCRTAPSTPGLLKNLEGLIKLGTVKTEYEQHSYTSVKKKTVDYVCEFPTAHLCGDPVGCGVLHKEDVRARHPPLRMMSR